jgi:tRNA pseudouridine13 synthase
MEDCTKPAAETSQQGEEEDAPVVLVWDPVEVELGISLYLSPEVPGFSAVSKGRYSDFVVHEVALDGSMAKLTSVEPVVAGGGEDEEGAGAPAGKDDAKERQDGNKRPRLDDEKAALAGAASSPEELDWKALEAELEAWVGKEAAAGAISFLQRNESTKETSKSKDDSPYYVALPPVSDKETRRKLHGWVREKLGRIASADTAEGGVIRIWPSRYRQRMPNKLDRQRGAQSRPRQSSRAPRNTPYIRFVLYKENMDTANAINQLSKCVVVGKKRRRQQQTLRMGYAGNKDKRGITSQFVTVSANAPVRHLCNVWNRGGSGGGATRDKGAALMRVGNFRYASDELRLGRLRGNRFDVVLRNVQIPGSRAAARAAMTRAAESLQNTGFVNYFGVQRFGKYHDTHLTGIAVLKGEYEEALNIIMRPKPDEKEEITAARQRWQDRFQTGGDRAAQERKCAEEVLKVMNRFMASEMSVLQSLARHPCDYKRAFFCISKTMRMMFLHALQSYLWNKVASFRLEKLGRTVVKGDLVLVDSEKATSESDGGMSTVKVVSEDDVATERYTLEDVVLPLIGVKTQDPENESGTMFDQVLSGHGLTRDMFRNPPGHDFHCAGDYRKLLCRPTDVNFEIIEYKDELQPLLQTDFMKLQGIEIEKSGGDGENALLAMVVGFTLPSSSYATLLLRELMKRPTSSEYQRELKLGGDLLG